MVSSDHESAYYSGPLQYQHYHRFLMDPEMTNVNNDDMDSAGADATASSSSFYLVHVSTPLLVLTASPLLGIIFISARMDLGLERPVIMGTIRTFVQLSILSMILQPIFAQGQTCGWLVLGYAMLMVLLAAYESMTRSRYHFPRMYLAVLAGLAFNICWVSLFAFGVVLRPDPLWNPQYVIPITGMLLGNCINGVGLGMNSMLTALVQQSREIELYLTFGATPAEATWRLMREAVRVAAMPQLNSMAIIGLINIPGMMTGQILGGSPVTQAARYQMLIMYLIAMCVFGTILAEITMALKAGFDHAHRLRSDFFVDTKKAGSHHDTIARSNWRRLCSSCYYRWCTHNSSSSNVNLPTVTMEIAVGGSDNDDESHYDSERTPIFVPDSPTIHTSNIDFQKVTCAASPSDSAAGCCLKVSKLSHAFSIPTVDESEEKGDSETASLSTTRSQQRRRVLFQGMSLELNAGEIMVIAGKSGVGKTTFMRLVAGLEPTTSTCGSIQLNEPTGVSVGKDASSTIIYDSQRDRALFRRRVRYVPQGRVDMPGTPKQFIGRILSLNSFSKDALECAPTPNHVSDLIMIKEVEGLIHAWGVDPTSALESEWTTLSGGEAQRVLLAISLASHPRVLLLDESTSALDFDTKLLVEQSIVHYCRSSTSTSSRPSSRGGGGMSVLWITHDRDQKERLLAASVQH